MPVRGSAYFNNPAFAQAAANLSALFAPPSGSDAAGWATANEKNAAAKRLAEFYDYAKRPDFDQTQFDRLGVGAGVYNPTQSYYAQDANNATQRYGYDTAAVTSRSNNAADNARAIDQTKLSEIGKMYQPLNEGQVRPDVPSDIAAMYGVPHAVEAAQGRDKPLTETELKAAVLGGMSPELQQAAAFGNTPVENVVTPEGPRIATRLDAIGQQPYEAPKGAGITTTLPDGTVVQVGGDKPMTEAQGKLVNYGSTAKAMNDVLDKFGNALTDPLMGASEASPSVGTLNPGNYMQSPEYQQARVAGERFVQAILRNESGAATPDAEIANYQATLLPRPGDSPEAKRLKAWGRQVAINALEGGMGLQARKAAIEAALQSGPPPGFTGVPAAAPAAADPVATPAPAADGAPKVRKYNPATGKIE